MASPRHWSARERGDNIPKALAALRELRDEESVDEALGELEDVAHQGTFFPPISFMLALLFKGLEQLADSARDDDVADYAMCNLAEVLTGIAEAIPTDMLEHNDILPTMAAMIAEQRLWSEVYDEDEDTERYEA